MVFFLSRSGSLCSKWYVKAGTGGNVLGYVYIYIKNKPRRSTSRLSDFFDKVVVLVFIWSYENVELIKRVHFNFFFQIHFEFEMLYIIMHG